MGTLIQDCPGSTLPTKRNTNTNYKKELQMRNTQKQYKSNLDATLIQDCPGSTLPTKRNINTKYKKKYKYEIQEEIQIRNTKKNYKCEIHKNSTNQTWTPH